MPARPNRPKKSLPEWAIPVLPKETLKPLSATDIKVWTYYRMSFGSTPERFGERDPPNHQQLADYFKISLASVRKSIRKLLRLGLLKQRYDPDYFAVSPSDTIHPLGFEDHNGL